MGTNSTIQWTHHTFNPWIGCVKISPGCTNCYAAVDTFPRVQRFRGRELWGINADRHVTSEANWRKPVAWDRAAARAGERHRVFCASMADVFEDRPDLAAPRARLFALIRRTPHLDWLLLTKRPEHIARLTHPEWTREPAPNVWYGTTVEDHRRAAERLDHLRRIPAAVRFLSCEPLLEDISDVPLVGIDWAIIGGESGPAARPCPVEWIERLVARCHRDGVAPFVKQLGASPLVVGLPLPLTDRKGGDPAGWPEAVRVREFPARHADPPRVEVTAAP